MYNKKDRNAEFLSLKQTRRNPLVAQISPFSFFWFIQVAYFLVRAMSPVESLFKIAVHGCFFGCIQTQNTWEIGALYSYQNIFWGPLYPGAYFPSNIFLSWDDSTAAASCLASLSTIQVVSYGWWILIVLCWVLPSMSHGEAEIVQSVEFLPMDPTKNRP